MTLGHDPKPLDHSGITIATQTTVPKTRHQRPFGWQNGAGVGGVKGLVGGGVECTGEWRLPPRTVASVGGDRHREVKREDAAALRTVAELSDANFSDDSLEEVPPPPPPASKRSSIAWEVPLDDDDPLYTPGSTKVIGRRRRRSTDRSSSGSMTRLRDMDEWPDPPTGTEDGSCSPLSDSSHLDSSTASKHDDPLMELSGTDMSSGGTYVVRKGRKKERKPMPLPIECETPPPPVNGEIKRCSSTFDNIKSLLREGLIEGLDDAPPDFTPPNPPAIVRVVSLPSLEPEEPTPVVTAQRKSRDDSHKFNNDLDVTLEEDENSQGSGKASSPIPARHDIGIQVMEDLQKDEVEPPSRDMGITVNSEAVQTDSDSERKCERSIVLLNGTDTSSNEALMIELRKEYDTESLNNNDHIIETANEESLEDPWLMATEISQVQVIPVLEKKEERDESTDESDKPPKEFKVKVEVLQHDFGPLPPSPVEEDDEYADVLRPSPAQTPRSKTERKESFYRCLEPPASDPLGTRFLNKGMPDHPHHKEQHSSSLKTRSMDAGFSRNHRAQHSTSSSSSRRDQIPPERRTLPSELQGPSGRRRTFQKRGSTRGEEGGGHLQVSCSLPETPIFARGCDIPRTPHRRAPDIPTSTRTTPRQLPSSSSTNSYRNTGTGISLNQAMAGAELLRLAGGPGRGWYPRHRQPRPASVEHLDRLTQAGLSPTSHPGPWDPSRKPQTLPPNLTPKFFHRSPREALRRVTSLLIRRGNSKEKKDTLSPTSGLAAYFVVGEAGEGSRQKRGFFRSFWKRSRHYSLEQQ